MKENINLLYNEFIKIRNMGYVKSLRDGPSGVGYTFETLLGKKEDHSYNPDFLGIEIKTVTILSKQKITLFNATPDGDYAEPIKRIRDLLGYPDKKNPEYKVFQMDVKARIDTWIGYYKKMNLYINNYDKKVELFAYRKNGLPIDIQTSWSYALLKERIEAKLSYLAIVEVCKKEINGELYYFYKRISFFQLKGFEYFIKLLKRGKIIITFKIGVERSGENIGRIHDRGTSFSIYLKDIPYLYKRIW